MEMMPRTSKLEGVGKSVKVRLCFTEELLGTCPSDENIYDAYVASKGTHVKEELEALQEVDEFYEGEAKPATVFPRQDGEPFLWDYQIKGCFKDCAGMLRRVKGTESSKLKAYKKLIDGLVFVTPRKIPLMLAGPEGTCQRPLRAQTAQGERITLASSETVPAGTTCEFEVRCLDPSLIDAVIEWLDYGQLRGMGQWRNSGKGAYTFDILTPGIH